MGLMFLVFCPTVSWTNWILQGGIAAILGKLHFCSFGHSPKSWSQLEVITKSSNQKVEKVYQCKESAPNHFRIMDVCYNMSRQMVEVKTNCCRKRGCSLRQQNICSDNLSCSRSREHQTTFASINLLEIMMHLDHQRRPFKNCKTYDFSDRRVNIILNIMLTLLWKGETASNIDTCPFYCVGLHRFAPCWRS